MVIKRIRIYLLKKSLVENQDCTDSSHRRRRQSLEVDVAETTPLLRRSNRQGVFCTQSSRYKIYDGILYAVQTILSYAAMLVVMSYSAWLFIAVVLGQTLGDAVFFHQPSLVMRNQKEPCSTSTSYQSMTINVNAEQESYSRDTTDNVIAVEIHREES